MAGTQIVEVVGAQAVEPGGAETAGKSLTNRMSGLLDISPILEDPRLNGANGARRAPPEQCDFSVSNDFEAIAAWLETKRTGKSSRTAEAYMREAQRFMLWAWLVRGEAISDMRAESMLAYAEFLRNPPAELVNTRPRGMSTAAVRAKAANLRFITAYGEVKWKPFNGGLTPENIQYTLTIIGAMFRWLVSIGYLVRSPLEPIRHEFRIKGYSHGNRNALSDRQWHAIVAYVELMPRSNTDEMREYERVRFLLMIFLNMRLRLSEIAQSRMNSFRPRRAAGGTNWEWLGVRKGDRPSAKLRDEHAVPAPTAAIDALSRYREAMGIAPKLPEIDDSRPLILNLSASAAIGKSQIYKILKSVFRGAAEAASALEEDERQALRSASTHWLRHTAATKVVNASGDLMSAQKLLNHADLKTTSRYLHASRDKLELASEVSSYRWRLDPADVR